jgi:hypothetical protein
LALFLPIGGRSADDIRRPRPYDEVVNRWGSPGAILQGLRRHRVRSARVPPVSSDHAIGAGSKGTLRFNVRGRTSAGPPVGPATRIQVLILLGLARSWRRSARCRRFRSCARSSVPASAGCAWSRAGRSRRSRLGRPAVGSRAIVQNAAVLHADWRHGEARSQAWNTLDAA